MNKNGRSYPGPNTIARHILPNGITLLAYENFASQSVVVEGLIQAGALAEPSAQAGLADFTADLLMRGTETRDDAQIYEALESAGAGLSFGSGRHTTQFSAYGLVEDFDLLLNLMAESLCTPIFPTEHIERIRGQLLTGLQIRANDTRRMADLNFMEMLYAGHPYGRSIRGYPDTISDISRADMVQFHHQNYGPRDMIITVVGAMKADVILDRVTAVLGNWHNPEQPHNLEVPNIARPKDLIRRDITLPDKSQSDFVLGLPGPRRSAPDYMHASLMNTVLGVFGMMGRIGQVVREEQGLAYYAYSHLSGGVGPYPWTAVAGVAPDKVEQAIESIRSEIRRMQDEPISEEELNDSKTYRIGSLPMGLETNSGLAGTITNLEYYQLGSDYLNQYANTLQTITVDQVQAAAQKYLDADNMAVAVAGSGGG